MKRFLPVADAVLRMVTETGVSPAAAQRDRITALWPLSPVLTATSATLTTASTTAALAAAAVLASGDADDSTATKVSALQTSHSS